MLRWFSLVFILFILFSPVKYIQVVASFCIEQAVASSILIMNQDDITYSASTFPNTTIDDSRPNSFLRKIYNAPSQIDLSTYVVGYDATSLDACARDGRPALAGIDAKVMGIISQLMTIGYTLTTMRALSARSVISSSVSRGLSDKWSDVPTVKDMGARMTGATTDIAPLQQSYEAAAPGVGIVNVPSGAWPSINGVPFAPTKSDQTKTILWNLLGPVTSGGSPLSRIGSGDVTESYNANSKNYARDWYHGVSDAPIVRLALNNYASDWHTDFQGASTPLALGISVYSHPGSNGNTVGAHVDLYSYGNTNGVAADQAYATGITKGGTNGVWGFAGQITDVTGHDADGTITWADELDIMSNGDDVAASKYDPSTSSRVFHFLSAKMQDFGGWTANHAYTANEHINAAGGPTGCGIYTVVSAGMSGSSEPAFTDAGNVIDGTVTWKYSASCQNVVGTGIEFTNDGASRYNTGIGSASTTFDNAALDFSKASNNPNVANGAMIRLPAGGIVDWSANSTAAGKNKHIMFYSPTAGFLYEANGSVVMAIHDDGNIVVPGTITAGYLMLNGPVQLQSLPKATILGINTAQEGMKFYDSDDHVEVTYRCPTASTCAWFPTQYGIALSNGKR
ncbi:hypothetical protein [Brytella acorum]|uniref:hypothetical protein n=1 Tax=Brytella acorum TaxID=2959299 RepID=UPI0025AEB27F|nr:hypothetical protein [Brytella acorum]MDF3626245.1 hypothetical protein [Brytella acorum]